jgi:hypothetical protein
MMDSQLKASLRNLHTALASHGPVDEELQDLLLQLDRDIKQLLEERASDGTEGEESTTYGLAERSQELSAQFAAKHPTLEPTLRELTRILGNMGI